MLTDSDIMGVLPAKDINRAKDFYRDKLGLEPAESPEDGSLVYRGGHGTGFLIYQTENAGTA
ncbi:MAG TPA: VOC family protein, partial [Arthrobacter sp.]